MRILYLQYTNPAGYPALGHSSRILANAGWWVLFLGTQGLGTAALGFPRHPRIKLHQLSYRRPGWKQQLHYAAFGLWAFLWGVRWRPQWIYASDPLSCPVAHALRGIPGVRVLYHEHDFPVTESTPPGARTAVQCSVMAARRELARRAAFCVLPNDQRIDRLRDSTGTTRPAVWVWNCPAREEAAPGVRDSKEMILHYHGNIGPELLPLTVLEAVARVPGITLRVIGYTTSGQETYPDILRQEAARLKISGRVNILPAMPRASLLAETRKASLGIALMPMASSNPNFHSMVGASNKPFDYLASGVPVLVSDLPDWRATFVNPGYGLACDPAAPASIAQAFRWIMRHKASARLMGELGRQRILGEWNYDHQFGRLGGANYLGFENAQRAPERGIKG